MAYDKTDDPGPPRPPTLRKQYESAKAAAVSASAMPVVVPFEGVDSLAIEKWRGTYKDRRSVNHMLLRDAEALITAGVSEAAAWYGGQLALEREQRIACAESLVLARDARDAAVLELREGRKLYQTTDRTADEGLVAITVARGISGWTVADLEEAAYRLRCGGAEDETPVEMDQHAAKAVVPAPNLIPLSTRKVSPLRTPEFVESGGRPAWVVMQSSVKSLATPARAATAAVAATLLACLVLMSWLIDGIGIPFM